MKTRVQKWGNSLALRIPKSFAQEVGLDDDVVVDISLADGKLVIVPLSEPPLVLADLLAAVTDHNIHREYDTNAPQGNEAW